MHKEDKFEMKFINHIFTKHKIPAASILVSLAALVVFFLASVFAAPPPGGYPPGTTSDPDCAPNDPNCFVLTQWANNGFDIYNTNDANVGIGTSTPTGLLDVLAANGTQLTVNDTDKTITQTIVMGPNETIQSILGVDPINQNPAGGWLYTSDHIPGTNIFDDIVSFSGVVQGTDADPTVPMVLMYSQDLEDPQGSSLQVRSDGITKMQGFDQDTNTSYAFIGESATRAIMKYSAADDDIDAAAVYSQIESNSADARLGWYEAGNNSFLSVGTAISGSPTAIIGNSRLVKFGNLATPGATLFTIDDDLEIFSFNKTVNIGTSGSPKGITMYEGGSPFCVAIVSGAVSTSAGACP